MLRNHFLTLLLLLNLSYANSQQDSLFSRQPNNRELAMEEIKSLKKGALIVRLKTSDKSVDAYRKAGQEELAQKITEQREAENLKLVEAFKYYFKFCKVYFIYARNTDELLKRKPGIFLNEKLRPDTSIRLTENYFLIAEYGSYTQNERTDDFHYSGVYKTEPSNSTASTSALVILDTSLNQLQEPFPFYEPVYLSAFIKGVDHLSMALEKAYSNTLYKEDVKQLKKKKGGQ
jgi:hypothetical protein